MTIPRRTFLAGSAALAAGLRPAFAGQPLTIAYPTVSGATWAIFIALEAGYYEQVGLTTKAVFGVHPAGIAMLVSGEAQMSHYGLDVAMGTAAKDGSFVIAGSAISRGTAALIARKGIDKIEDLRGKRLGIGRIGDPFYQVVLDILRTHGMGTRDVSWVPIGGATNQTVAALAGGQIDAALLTSPGWFRLEADGYTRLMGLNDAPGIWLSTCYLYRRSTLEATPDLAEKLLKAHAMATQRFYADPTFAVATYMKYDKQSQPDVERLYALFAQGQIIERVPYLAKDAVTYVLDKADPATWPGMKSYDFTKVITNQPVDKLVQAGFYREVFGAEIDGEIKAKRATAFNL